MATLHWRKQHGVWSFLGNNIFNGIYGTLILDESLHVTSEEKSPDMVNLVSAPADWCVLFYLFIIPDTWYLSVTCIHAVIHIEYATISSMIGRTNEDREKPFYCGKRDLVFYGYLSDQECMEILACLVAFYYFLTYVCWI